MAKFKLNELNADGLGVKEIDGLFVVFHCFEPLKRYDTLEKALAYLRTF